MWSAWTWKTAAKQRSRRLRRNEVFRSAPYSRSARRRPLAAGRARLLHRIDIRRRRGHRLVHVRVERRSSRLAEGGGGRARLARAIREQAAARRQPRSLQVAARGNGAQLRRHAAAIAGQDRGAESSGRHFADRSRRRPAGEAVPAGQREEQRLLCRAADQNQAGGLVSRLRQLRERDRRIATLQDIQISPLDSKNGYDNLTMDVTAKTYRYIEDEGARSAKKKAGGAT